MNKYFYFFLLLSSLCFAQNDCIQGDCEDGYGTKMYPEGQYEGFFEEGKRTNVGSILFNNKTMYIGSWKNDTIQGFGIIKINDSILTIVGNFKNGKLHRKGVKYFKDNTVEAGYYINDKISTQYSFDNNSVEFGCVMGNCESFYGRYKFENGDQFNGFFENKHMLYGSYIFSNKATYIGGFDENGALSGVGIYVYPNGNYFFGNWENSTYEGMGMFHNIVEDKKLVGYWKNGELQIEVTD